MDYLEDITLVDFLKILGRYSWFEDYLVDYTYLRINICIECKKHFYVKDKNFSFTGYKLVDFLKPEIKVPKKGYNYPYPFIEQLEGNLEMYNIEIVDKAISIKSKDVLNIRKNKNKLCERCNDKIIKEIEDNLLNK